jgi:hypothetical protein
VSFCQLIFQVALDAQIKHNSHERELQQEAHCNALTALSGKHEDARAGFILRIQRLQDLKDQMRDRLVEVKSRKLWGTEEAIQLSVFMRWKQAHLRRVSDERDRLSEAVANCQEQIKDKKADLKRASHSLSLDVQRIYYCCTSPCLFSVDTAHLISCNMTHA